MKKLSVFASLILFFAIFAPGVAVGMEELPEREPQMMGEKSLAELPPDVRKIIANKTLRLILDDAEDDPSILMEKEWCRLVGRSFEEKSWGLWFRSIGLALCSTNRSRLIDFIILLVENGADPNTKSYKGNMVLHLLIKDLEMRFIKWINKEDDKELRRNPQKIYQQAEKREIFKLKIEVLSRYTHLVNGKEVRRLDINTQNNKGNTIAHELINEYSLWAFFFLKDLIPLGLNITTIKNFNGDTPCELGRQKLREEEGVLDEEQLQYYGDMLNKLCSGK